MRRGEALGLLWSDIDFTQGTVTVCCSASYDKTGFSLGRIKTENRNRTLMLPDVLKSAFQKEREKQAQLARFIGSGFNQIHLVCCREEGSPITTNVLQHEFKDALQAAGLPDLRFHDLRHTNATLMLRNAIPAKIVSSMLGHSTIGITMDLYSHVTTDMQGGAVHVMDELLKKC